MAANIIRFAGHDPRIHTLVGKKIGNVIRLRAQPGFGLFGPYIDLPKCSCVARIFFDGAARGRVTADLLAERETVLASRVVDLDTLRGDPLELSATLDSPQSACEVRLLCDPTIYADISAVEIEICQHGTNNASLDQIDCMHFIGGFENPDKKEEVMKQIYRDAETDECVRFILKRACLEKDVKSSFEFYRNTGIPNAIIDLFERFNVDRSAHIVDVGCGRGHAAHALYERGFECMTAMDPNPHLSSGTGYLASLGTDIEIINDIAVWRATYAKFDAAFSTSTVHHWQHIPHYAIDLRRTLKSGGHWFMITEYFANNGPEFMSLLGAHPFARRYGTYEWPYPASAYVDLVESIGFRLVAVIPLHYRNNLFYMVKLPEPDDPLFNVENFSCEVDALLDKPDGTVTEFWKEVSTLRYREEMFRNPLSNLYSKRFYTNPQVLIFRRIEVV